MPSHDFGVETSPSSPSRTRPRISPYLLMEASTVITSFCISSVGKIGEYRQLAKLANIVSCQNWQISSVAKIGKQANFVAKIGKFCGHQSCQNWSFNTAKENIWQILDIILKFASNAIFQACWKLPNMATEHTCLLVLLHTMLETNTLHTSPTIITCHFITESDPHTKRLADSTNSINTRNTYFLVRVQLRRKADTHCITETVWVENYAKGNQVTAGVVHAAVSCYASLSMQSSR